MIIKIKKHIVSKVLFIREGKVLILERAQVPSLRSPWTWDLPGGHVEPGETPEEGAYREVMEEISITPDVLSKIHEESNAGKHTHFYVCESWKGDVVLSHEHKSYKWATPQEMEEYKLRIGKMYYEVIMRAMKT